jgi:hypothetical protein
LSLSLIGGNIEEREQMKRTWALIGLVLVTLACSLSAPTPAAWSGTPTAEVRNATSTAFAATHAAELTSMPTLPPTKTPTPVGMTPTASTNITSGGPWLIFPAHDGANLLAYDLALGTLTGLDLPPLANLNDLKDGLSGDGKVLLLRAGSIENLNELALYKVTDPNEPIGKVTPLLSIYLQRQIINQVGKRPARAMNAVLEDGGIAWSPKNNQVVFAAALDADSGDLYLLDLVKDKLERLTAKYAQDLSPIWSPGGGWIVFEEAETQLENGDWHFTAVSAFRIPRFDETRFLYLPPSASIGEVFLGWTNAISFLSYTCTEKSCQNLRQVDLETISVKSVYYEHFSEANYAAKSHAIALVLDQKAASMDGKSAGVYFSAYEGAPFTQIMAGDFTNLSWSEAGGMFLVTGKMGVMGIKPERTSITLQNEAGAAFSPNGAWLVGWNDDSLNPGIRLYSANGNYLQTISTDGVRYVTWQADSKGLVMVTDSGIYLVTFPGLQPTLITEDIFLGDGFEMVWLNP